VVKGFSASRDVKAHSKGVKRQWRVSSGEWRAEEVDGANFSVPGAEGGRGRTSGGIVTIVYTKVKICQAINKSLEMNGIRGGWRHKNSQDWRCSAI